MPFLLWILLHLPIFYKSFHGISRESFLYTCDRVFRTYSGRFTEDRIS